jgi:hypothetical protein
MKNNQQKDHASVLAGSTVLGAYVTGVAGLVMAVIAVLSADFVGAGVALAASALAFGLLANAFFRQ